MTSEFIKRKAEELGATICGIGRIYEEENPQKDPRSFRRSVIKNTMSWL